MIRLDAGRAADTVICIRTSDNRLDYVRGSAVTSAGFLREKTDTGSRWALVLNYQSPFYTKVTDLDEAFAVIEELYGQCGVEQARAIVDKCTGKLP